MIELRPIPMQVQTFEPTLENEVHNYIASLDSYDDVDNIDLPIVIRKCTDKYTQHPLSSFVSFENFSPSHKAFLT